MCNSILILAVALGLELGLTTGVRSAPPAKTDAGPIANLITQLGSTKFKEREAAMQALDAIGGPALEALRHAAQSSDPEISRRAESLAQLIRKRIETAQFLEPLRVRLVYKDTPVLEAVEDLAKKTEFSIELAGPKARLADRKVTLDTGETSFWEAFDQFCQKAGLVERAAAAPESELRERLLVEAKLRELQRAVNVGQKPMVQITDVASTVGWPRSWDGRLTLVDGKPPLLPTYYAGALRIRALPANSAAWGVSREELLLLLEVTPQPRIEWHQVTDLRIDKAIDEHGQSLAPSLETRGDWGRITGLANGVMMWDEQNGRLLTAVRDFPIQLKAGEKPSGTLKEVKGIVAAQIQTAPQPLITVDNIFTSAGQTVTGHGGESLRVIEAKRQPGGDVSIRIELNDGLQGNALWAAKRGVWRANRVVFAKGVVIANGMAQRGVLPGQGDNAGNVNLVLQDAKGQSFPRGSNVEDLVINGNTVAREITVTYHSRSGLGEPNKLVYSGRRSMIIEVPFTLKDVSLP